MHTPTAANNQAFTDHPTAAGKKIPDKFPNLFTGLVTMK